MLANFKISSIIFFFFKNIFFENFLENFFGFSSEIISQFSGIMPSRSRSPSLPRPRGRGGRSRSRDHSRSRSPYRRHDNWRGSRYDRDIEDDRRDRPRRSPRASPRPADATTTALLQLQQQQQKQLSDQAASLAAIHRHLGIG